MEGQWGLWRYSTSCGISRLTHFMRCCVVGVVRLLLMSHRLATPPRLVATALCCAMSVSAVAGAAAVEQKRSYNLPSGDAATMKETYLKAQKAIDKAAAKGIIKKNTAARKKSRLNAAIKKASLKK